MSENFIFWYWPDSYICPSLSYQSRYKIFLLVHRHRLTEISLPQGHPSKRKKDTFARTIEKKSFGKLDRFAQKTKIFSKYQN